MMKQYNQMKEKHPDAILLFRCGDFYETYASDAVRASKILGITLTRRSAGTPNETEMAGFPYHALDTYLPKLVRAGQRVAICEQLEDPSKTKTLVKRGITELVTPGVSLSESVLENRENNFLAAVHCDQSTVGVAFLDISTGEFLVGQGSVEYVDKLLNSFQPKELLYDRMQEQWFKDNYYREGVCINKLDDWIFTSEAANDKLLAQFETTSLKGFGIHEMHQAVIAAGAILYYLDITEHKLTSHIRNIARIDQDTYVWLDKFTIRNLELLGSDNVGAKNLFSVLDNTRTPMGARLLRRWISLPLRKIADINARLEAVQSLVEQPDVLDELSQLLKSMCDLERVIARVATNRITPRELLQLQRTLDGINPMKHLCEQTGNESLLAFARQLNACEALCERIVKEIQPEAPNAVNKGNVINSGVNAELDSLREIAYNGKDYLLKMQEREEERTGIPKVKIAFNNVFGYYIEVRNTHKDKVPEDWIRKQTLVGAERYITQELKEYEEKILGAESRIMELEQSIYSALIQNVASYIATIQLDATILAQIDCLSSFAIISVNNNYVRPIVNDSMELDIKNGRHPVIETEMAPGEKYVGNDVYLDNEKQQIIIITGPNMAGKSALLRQTALIVLMAQMGCFVPADAVTMGIVDKVFTRVGASDNISQGESTFMVEMNEAANILNNMTDRSLVLFDELGRGTSTYDGISIAWAIVEYLHECPNAKPKTLFATHYHELNELEKSFNRVKNFNVSVREQNHKVIFLRKLVPGGSEHSFGIHVAKMAGMPKTVVSRANEILKDLEDASKNMQTQSKVIPTAPSKKEGYQLSLFQLDDPLLEKLRDELLGLEINSLTPIEALNKLNEIKKMLEE
ncbi:MAG: DNA mismatch repair protein MutS [Bacteroidales bacterium]|nr:DNA mismatch repair protein MutS [Bacteroidales bacterium]